MNGKVRFGSGESEWEFIKSPLDSPKRDLKGPEKRPTLPPCIRESKREQQPSDDEGKKRLAVKILHTASEVKPRSSKLPTRNHRRHLSQSIYKPNDLTQLGKKTIELHPESTVEN